MDVRILEYSGLDTTQSAGCDGRSGGEQRDCEQRSGDHDLGERADLWRGHDGGRLLCGAGTGFTSRIITSRTETSRKTNVVSSTGSYSATGNPAARQLGDADGDVPGQRAGGGNPAPTVSAITPIQERRTGDGGDHHRHRLPGGSDSEAGRNISDRSDGGEQHIDHGDDPGACGGRGERGSDQHRCADRHVNQRIHLHGDQSGADGEFDHAEHRERRMAGRR